MSQATMARPRQKIGTYGNIKTTKLPSGKHKARTRFRLADGSYTEVERIRDTKGAAEGAVKDRCLELVNEVRGAEINPDTQVKHIAKLYLAELQQNAKLGEGAETSAQRYGYQLKNWIIPKIGQLTARELQVSVLTCEKLFTYVREHAGKDGTDAYATAKLVRAVLNGLCSYCIRHGAMTANPVKSAGKIAGATKKEVKALEPEQREDLLIKLRAFAVKKQTDSMGREMGHRSRGWVDLPDMLEGMLATGGRIGEIIAASGDEVDTTEKQVTLGFHIVRVPGDGLHRKAGRKGGQPALTLGIPDWSIPMWRRRKLAAGKGPLFPASRGSWLDPSNVTHRMREALDDIGYSWVTSHVFRKSVGTHLDRSGVSVTEGADQLGNTPAVYEKHYRAKRAGNNPAAVAALETIRDVPRAN